MELTDVLWMTVVHTLWPLLLLPVVETLWPLLLLLSVCVEAD